MSPARRFLPPLVPAAVLLTHVALMYRAALRHTGGVISYPVDDTFIHLSLAKHLAFDGIYGVSGHEFAAASSSVGWPLLLAALMKVAGASAWLPLATNAAFGVVLSFVVDAAVRRLAPDASVLARILVGLAVVVLTPMPTVVVIGMEHTAHIVANVAFVGAASRWLATESDDDPIHDRTVLSLAALAASVTLWRYEGAFPILIVCALAVLRRRWKSAIVIGTTGALPGVAFGLYAKAHGSLFLPIPVVLKGRHLEGSKLGDLLGVDLMDRFGSEAPVLVVAIACALLGLVVIQKRGLWSPLALALVTTLGVIVLHLELASLGWFYRYESYLLASGIAFVAASLASLSPSPRRLWERARATPGRAVLALLTIALFAMPLRRRAVAADDDTPTACRNIFEQQLQSARFLARFERDLVAINDIGAVAWLRDEPFVDLVGLATLPIARAKGLKLDQPLRPADLARLTAGVKVAIVYDEWFGEGLPPSWLLVGRWRIGDNRTCAFPVVSIYATDPATYPEVLEELRRFSAELPKGVVQLGRYLRRARDDGRFRPGDEVVVTASAPELSGAHVVAEDGAILVIGAGKVPVASRTPAEVQALLAERIEAAPAAPAGALDLRGATIARVDRLAARPPAVQVVGRVARAIETSAMTLETALAAAGAAPGSRAAWIWRERDDRFTKLEGAELERGALVDGDIVVVP